MRQGVLISTTEHLLSVFYSMGIDNATSRSTTSKCPSSMAQAASSSK
jgi:UDP-3-O-acyl-N-acetylglucosamine deacetylase